jgi:hypothetical protein
MTAQHSADTPPGADADRAPPKRGGRRRPAVRWIVHGLLFVALVAGIFGLLPRLGGLTRDAAGDSGSGWPRTSSWPPSSSAT